MLFPRPTNLHPELTPAHVVDPCMSYTPNPSGPATRRGPLIQGRGAVRTEDGDDWKASRLSYHLNIGELTRTPVSLKEGIVCHHCDNSWCIQPKHLYLGTAKQNTIDIYARNKTIRELQGLAKIGNTNRVGKKASAETRAKMSLAKMGNTNSNSFHHLMKTKEKMSLSHTGMKHSKETRAKMTESQLLRWTKRKAK